MGLLVCCHDLQVMVTLNRNIIERLITPTAFGEPAY